MGTAIMKQEQPQYMSIKAACEKKEDELLNKITEELVKCAQYRGQVIAREDAVIAAGMYLADLKEDFDGLDTIEIAPIMRKGVRGEWGEFYGLNAATLRKWTEAYLVSEARKEYRTAKWSARYAIAEKRTVTEAEIDERSWRTLQDDYRTYFAWKIGNWTRCNNIEYDPAGSKIGEPLWDRNGIRLAILKAHGYEGSSVKEVFDIQIAKDKKEI